MEGMQILVVQDKVQTLHYSPNVKAIAFFVLCMPCCIVPTFNFQLTTSQVVLSLPCETFTGTLPMSSLRIIIKEFVRLSITMIQWRQQRHNNDDGWRSAKYEASDLIHVPSMSEPLKGRNYACFQTGPSKFSLPVAMLYVRIKMLILCLKKLIEYCLPLETY